MYQAGHAIGFYKLNPRSNEGWKTISKLLVLQSECIVLKYLLIQRISFEREQRK